MKKLIIGADALERWADDIDADDLVEANTAALCSARPSRTPGATTPPRSRRSRPSRSSDHVRALLQPPQESRVKSTRLISPLGGAMVAVLALVMVACGDSEESQVATTQPAPTATELTTTIAPEAPSVDPATALIGVWLPPGGGYLAFQEDDTWTWKLMVSLDPSDEGGYTFEDGVVTFTTDVGSDFCSDLETGVYEVAFESQDEMAWTAVSDECIGRVDAIGKTVLRYVP